MRLTGPPERTCHGCQLPDSCRSTWSPPRLVSRHQVLSRQLWTCLNSVASSVTNPTESFSCNPFLSSFPMSDLPPVLECPPPPLSFRGCMPEVLWHPNSVLLFVSWRQMTQRCKFTPQPGDFSLGPCVDFCQTLLSSAK